MGEIPSSPFFIEMTTFPEALSEKGKQDWPQIYKQLTGKEWLPPKRDKRAIYCEAKLEGLPEIDKLMRQKPNYTISKQGRGG